MLVTVMLLINGMNVINSYISRYFMSAIEVRDTERFIHFGWVYAGGFTIATILATLSRYAEERLGLLWRDWITRRVTNLYIDGRAYLHLHVSGNVTNPDQRITEDVKLLTATTLSFIILTSNGIMTACFFSGVLYHISPWLFAVSILYALVGSGITFFFGQPLIGLNYHQSDYEADFRSDLIRLEAQADGIALAGYESRMRSRLMTRIDRLVGNMYRIILVNRRVNAVTTLYNYMIQLIPVLIVAPLFIRHGVEFGVIGQASIAFSTLLGAFSLIITQFQSISAYSAVVSRLAEFLSAINRANDQSLACKIHYERTAAEFRFRDLTLWSDERESEPPILENLTATFHQGRPILVCGGGLAGKQALFRAAAGLHGHGSGVIGRPRDEEWIFLPKVPFLPPATLREMLVSLHSETATRNVEIAQALQETGLYDGILRYGDVETRQNWHEVLSPTEQQLLAITRVLLARPMFAFFDHPESTLPPEQKQELVELLTKRGVTCVLFTDQPFASESEMPTLDLKQTGRWSWRNGVEPRPVSSD